MKPTIEHLTAQFGPLVAQPPPVPTPLPVAAGTEGASAPPVAPVPSPIQATSHALKGYDLDLTVPPHEVVAAASPIEAPAVRGDAERNTLKCTITVSIAVNVANSRTLAR
jgi:hypothetical protein